MIRALTTRRAEMAPFLLLLPAIATMLFVVALPLVFSLWTSLTPYKLTKPGHALRLHRPANYIRIFGDWDFWAAFGRTVLFLTVASTWRFVLGLGLALLVNKITCGPARPAHHHDVSDDVFADPGRLPVQVPVQRQCRPGEQRAAIAGPDRSGDPLAGGCATWRCSRSSLAEVWMRRPRSSRSCSWPGLFAMPHDPLEAAQGRWLQRRGRSSAM